MFEYIRGKLIEAVPGKAIIDVGGIGYGIIIALNTYSRLPSSGKEIFLYLSPVIREDAHSLYGFITREEKELFSKFTQISGIGPKTALSLIGHMEISDLHMALLSGNTLLLSKIPGIGKKTAERLVIEMRDKVHATSVAPKGIASDAISALINLGYPPLKAQKAVKDALSEGGKDLGLSQLISLSLKVVG